MDKYESLGVVGEGSYGVVTRCRHKHTKQLVAIKKFLESEDDDQVKKIAMREIRMLKTLKHENLVNLIEVFRRKKRLYLVFEYVDRTLLKDMESCPKGINPVVVRKYMWQLLLGLGFCHSKNVIHRDIKPENILVSKQGLLKLCDFGFARSLAGGQNGYTDYVATRWYRAPELLVGDVNYGKPVDIWAVGCLLPEMLTNNPLFPGDSDIDQLHYIVRGLGNLCPKHVSIFKKNAMFLGVRLPQAERVAPLNSLVRGVESKALEFIASCLEMDPDKRGTCETLQQLPYFCEDGFADNFSSPMPKKEKTTKSKSKHHKKKREYREDRGGVGGGDGHHSTSKGIQGENSKGYTNIDQHRSKLAMPPNPSNSPMMSKLPQLGANLSGASSSSSFKTSFKQGVLPSRKSNLGMPQIATSPRLPRNKP